MAQQEDIKDVTKVAAKAAAEASWPQTRVVLRVIIIILAVAVTLWIVVKLTAVILLLVLSIFFAYLVSPLVDFLRKPIRLSGRDRVMPRILAISLAYLIIVGAIVLAFYVLLPRLGNQFPEFAQQARGYWKALGESMQRFNDYLRLRMPGPVMDAINHEIPRVVQGVGDTLSEVVKGMVLWFAYIPWLVLIPVLSFFFLKDAESFRNSALQMLPRGRWRWRGDEFFQDVSRTLAAYTRAQLTACILIGILCSVGFALLGIPSPLVLGFIAGVFEFVPLVGPLLIGIIAAVVGGLHGGSSSALMVILFLTILRIVQDYYIYPKLIGQGIHLHPLAVIIAILAGAELAGIAGIFLAIPVVAIMTVSYRHWLEHRGSEGLADLLEPTPETSAEETAAADAALLSRLGYDVGESKSAKVVTHPTQATTPADMARARPDLTTGELKLPIE
ncbi:MAG TPA: AI-2E family transporter [Pyrinomonadaceae bacterium]|nr:AI-2E family transporter [Pyrinomonadaceae bacterium]